MYKIVTSQTLLMLRLDRQLFSFSHYCIIHMHFLHKEYMRFRSYVFPTISSLQLLTWASTCSTGDVTERLCTAAELKFYFDHFFQAGSSSFLEPNINCNLANWVAGCEPGWASRVGSNQQVNLTNSQYIPARTTDSQPCCAGFFCPRGLTCMIRKYLNVS